MSMLTSHTHCQAAPANAQTKAWQRVCLFQRTPKTTDKQADEKEARLPNRVARPEPNGSGLGSHTTVRTGLVYGGSYLDGLNDK